MTIADNLGNLKRIFREWVIFDPGDDAPGTFPDDSVFRIDDLGSGHFRFEPIANVNLAATDLAYYADNTPCEHGHPVPGLLRGTFAGHGDIQFRISTVGRRRYFMEIDFLGSKGKLRGSLHGGPHGTDN